MIRLKSSWKQTLHLPESRFPARALVKDRPTYIKRCTDDLYAWQQKRELPRTFTLHDGPPYANGDLHIGHALNKILKDIICRSRLAENRVEWRPGWDCHGLPIELKALQQQGGKELQNAVSVRAAARKLAVKTVGEQKQSFREWGIMADWENSWTTMDKGFEIKQLAVFKEMVKKGLVYRRFKPVYWSPSSRTALAEAELEYRNDHVSTAAFVRYPLCDGPKELKEKLGFEIARVNAVIWTTTPWTLPANKAIGIHKDIQYAIVESPSHGRLLIATSRLSEVERHLSEALRVLLYVDGRDLAGSSYTDPAFDSGLRPRPLLNADFVSESSGSGLVHLAPGHGMDEYELCKKHDVVSFAPLDDHGRFTAGTGSVNMDFLVGKEVLTTGNQEVLKHMSDRGQLLGQHQYTHNYPYDWRSKQPVIVRATEQWFADISGIRYEALEALRSVNFVPAGSKTRLETFIKNRSEWCISRQRAWGVPIPALYHSETNESLLTEHSVSHIISVIKERGIDAWWTNDDSDPVWTPPSHKTDNDQSAYRRGKDTMDVWFDSGTSWTQTESSEDDGHVADCYIEGTDQHRGWFQSSLLTHVASQGIVGSANGMVKAPFKTLVTHGFTLDHAGRKMSKSVGNVVSPSEIMDGTLLLSTRRKVNGQWTQIQDAMGPDALRLWVASCDYSADVKVSQTVLQAINSNLAKYRVTFKLMLGILEDFDPSSYVHPEKLDMIHHIALRQLGTVVSRVQNLYQSLRFNMAVTEINKYINNDLSSSYFEWIKDAAYCGKFESRLQVQGTLYQIFSHLQQMLLPITPLLVEEVWDYTPKQVQSYEIVPPAQRLWTELDSHHIDDDHRNSDVSPLMEISATVKSTQEIARSGKDMGDSLQSFVCVEANSAKVWNLFDRYDMEQLAIIFGVSGFTYTHKCHSAPERRQTRWCHIGRCNILGEEVLTHVYEPSLAKCGRCWRYTAPVGVEPALCTRCEGVMKELQKTSPDLFTHSVME